MRGRRIPSHLLSALVYLAAVGSVLLFVTYPLLRMVAQVFAGDLSLADCGEVLSSQVGVIGGSVGVAALAACASTVLALAIALVIAFGNRMLGRLMVGVATMSIISPPFVASLAYIMLFGRRGLITHGILGLDVSPYGWQGVVVMQVLFFSAINVLMLASVLRRLDGRLLDAARDLGASAGRVLMDVVLPLLAPTMLSCALLTFVRSLSDYGTPVVIGGSFETISSEIYLQVVGYSDLGTSALLNLLLMVIAIIVFMGYGRLGVRSERLVVSAGAPSAGEGRPVRLDGPLGVLAYALALLFLAFMAVLYATIVRTAFSSGIGWTAQPSLANLEHLASFNLATLLRSLAYAGLAAALATLLAMVIAYFVHRRKVVGGGVLEFLVTLPYLIPGTCFGLGYLLAFNSLPLKFTGTAAIVVLVLVFKRLAISEQTFSQSMAQISPELDMAARDLGASRLGVFADVIVPNLSSATLVSLVNVFSSSMVAYGAVLFLVSAGHKIAVFELFDALSGGKYGTAAMMSVAILAVTLAVNATFALSVGTRRN